MKMPQTQNFHNEKSNSSLVRSSIYIAALILAFPSFALADVTIECPARDELLPMTLNFSGETLAIKDIQGATTMPATLEPGQPGAYTIMGRGSMVTLMPDLVEFDKCLTAKLKEQDSNVADKGMLGYVENACRLMLLASSTPQKTDASVTITSLEPKIALVSTLATYLKPSEVTGERLEIGNLLPRTCNIVSGP